MRGPGDGGRSWQSWRPRRARRTDLPMRLSVALRSQPGDCKTFLSNTCRCPGASDLSIQVGVLRSQQNLSVGLDPSFLVQSRQDVVIPATERDGAYLADMRSGGRAIRGGRRDGERRQDQCGSGDSNASDGSHFVCRQRAVMRLVTFAYASRYPISARHTSASARAWSDSASWLSDTRLTRACVVEDSLCRARV